MGRIDRVVRVLFSGGGTGGHVYPAIAIARAVQRQHPNCMIRFAGTKTHMEWRAVPAAGYPITPITARGLQRKQLVNNLGIPFAVARGLFESWRLIRQFDPQVVVGTGGYVSAPVLWMASRMGRPTVIQEQNAFPGKTNRALASRAESIHIAFAEAAQRLPEGKCSLSGNPTRPELLTATREAGRRLFNIPADRVVLLVFGGSGGSAALNKTMAANATTLLQDPSLHIIWQTGKRYYEEYRDAVPDHDRLLVLEYLDRMPLTLAAADFAVCRSGAVTCSELEVTGTPAILVPSPNVAGDHQTWNARSIVEDGGAVLLPEENLEERFIREVQSLAGDEVGRQRMSRALTGRARPNAADDIAADVIAIAKRSAE